MKHTMLQFNSALQSPVQHNYQHVGHITKNASDSLPENPKLLMLNTCTVMAASGTDQGLIVHCYLTFQLGKRHFREKFIVL